MLSLLSLISLLQAQEPSEALEALEPLVPALESAISAQLGAKDVEQDCWPIKNNNQDFCLTPTFVQNVQTKSGTRVYVLLFGYLDEVVMQETGLVATFIFLQRGSTYKLILGSHDIRTGIWGTPPNYTLVALGPNNYWGWYSEPFEHKHSNVSAKYTEVLMPYGKGFVSRIIQVTYQDALRGHYMRSEVSFDSSYAGKVYPLKVSVHTDGQKGKRKYLIPFDRKTWMWNRPKDYPEDLRLTKEIHPQ